MWAMRSPGPDLIRARAALDAIPVYRPGRPPSAPAGCESFKMSSNENPYPPLPSVVDAITRAAAGINRYPDTGVHELRERIGDRCGVPADEVITGAGSCALLGQIAEAFIDPGDEVVYAWRSFELYPILVGLQGGRSVQVPLTHEGRHNLEWLARSITRATTLVLLCSPNNPTGAAIQHDEARAFLERVPPHVLVVIDEAYIEFNRDESTLDAFALYREYPSVVVLRTFSKAYGLAGLRAGYALARGHAADAIRKAAMPFALTDIAQAAALASLDAADELAARVDLIVAERERVTAALAAQGWQLPRSEANFVWLPLGRDTDAFVQAAGEAGLSVRGFRDDGVRVSVDEPAANDRFLALAGDFRREHG